MQSALDKTLDALSLPGGDQWTHIGVLVGGIADADLLDFAQEGVHESIIDAILHIDAGGGCTILAAVYIAADNGPVRAGFDICIVIHNERRFAAKFEMHMF